jgi:hypothetical protein
VPIAGQRGRKQRGNARLLAGQQAVLGHRPAQQEAVGSVITGQGGVHQPVEAKALHRQPGLVDLAQGEQQLVVLQGRVQPGEQRVVEAQAQCTVEQRIDAFHPPGQARREGLQGCRRGAAQRFEPEPGQRGVVAREAARHRTLRGEAVGPGQGTAQRLGRHARQQRFAGRGQPLTSQPPLAGVAAVGLQPAGSAQGGLRGAQSGFARLGAARLTQRRLGQHTQQPGQRPAGRGQGVGPGQLALQGRQRAPAGCVGAHGRGQAAARRSRPPR